MASATGQNIGIWIFLDDSNLWISSKKLQGEQLNHQFFNEDPRGRIDLGRFSTWALEKRPLKKAILFGSEPPPIDTYWNSAYRKRFKVNKFMRNPYSGKEKQVDTEIVAGITDLVAFSHLRKSELYDDGKNIIILVSGDADMKPAVDKVIAQNGIWKIEIVGFENTMAQLLKDLEKKHPQIVKIRFVTLDDFSFIQVVCKVKLINKIHSFL